MINSVIYYASLTIFAPFSCLFISRDQAM